MIKHYYEKWKQFGAIAPSSRFLARAITDHVDASDCVLEIGAGSGAFTKVLARKVPGAQLHVLEVNPDFEEALEAHTPNVYIDDALDFLEAPPLDLSGFKVISSLPLLNFDEDFRKTLLTRLLAGADVASVRQFTYSPRPLFGEAWLGERGMCARHVDFVLLNLPPASVWEYTGAGRPQAPR